MRAPKRQIVIPLLRRREIAQDEDGAPAAADRRIFDRDVVVGTGRVLTLKLQRRVFALTDQLELTQHEIAGAFELEQALDAHAVEHDVIGAREVQAGQRHLVARRDLDEDVRGEAELGNAFGRVGAGVKQQAIARFGGAERRRDFHRWSHVDGGARSFERHRRDARRAASTGSRAAAATGAGRATTATAHGCTAGSPRGVCVAARLPRRRSRHRQPPQRHPRPQSCRRTPPPPRPGCAPSVDALELQPASVKPRAKRARARHGAKRCPEHADIESQNRRPWHELLSRTHDHSCRYLAFALQLAHFHGAQLVRSV